MDREERAMLCAEAQLCQDCGLNPSALAPDVAEAQCDCICHGAVGDVDGMMR